MEEGERDRLVKVLRMFGSDHDGEVAAAARRAHSILRRHRLDWDDLVIPVSASAGHHRQQEQKREQDTRQRTQDDDTDEAFLIRRAREPRFKQHLSQWELEFLNSIAESLVEWGKLTERQRAVLDRINNKLKLRGCW